MKFLRLGLVIPMIMSFALSKGMWKNVSSATREAGKAVRQGIRTTRNFGNNVAQRYPTMTKVAGYSALGTTLWYLIPPKSISTHIIKPVLGPLDEAAAKYNKLGTQITDIATIQYNEKAANAVEKLLGKLIQKINLHDALNQMIFRDSILASTLESLSLSWKRDERWKQPIINILTTSNDPKVKDTLLKALKKIGQAQDFKSVIPEKL